MRGFPASREAVRRSRGVPGPLGHGASSAAAAIAGMGWVAGADLVSGATLWKVGSRMLEYHERPRSGHGKHRH